MKLIACLSGACLTLASSIVFANNNMVGANYAMGKVVLALLLVTGLIISLAWLFKRSGMFTFVVSNKMRVVSSLPLSAREKIVLVKVGNSCMLLGVASGKVSLLKEMNDEDLEAAFSPVTKSNKAMSEKTDFSSYLKSILDPGKIE